MSRPFPLLRLPQLVLGQVVKNFSPTELLYFSLCSRRAQATVTVYRRKKMEPFITLLCNVGPGAQCKQKKCHLLNVQKLSEAPKDAKIMNIGGFRVPTSIHGYMISTFWPEKFSGILRILDHVRTTFDTDFFEVLIGKSRKISCFWNSSKSRIQDSDFSHFLENCKASEKFRLALRPKSGKKYEFTGRLPQPTFNFTANAPWITLPQLLSLNCSEIHLRDSRLKNAEISAFLKHWIKGGCDELEELRMENTAELASLRGILKGFAVQKTDIEEHFDFHGDLSFHTPESLVRSYDIERYDGKVASVWTVSVARYRVMVSVHPFVHDIFCR